MNQAFQLQYPYLLYGGLLLIGLAILYRTLFSTSIAYRYSLVSRLNLGVRRTLSGPILFALRTCALALLALLMARPQIVDADSTVHVDGIDIVLALDFSNSMQLFDDLNDRRSRIEVAKAEAINFIDKRDNDQIGIVIFGQDAVSRCPLTLDKQLLKKIISELKIGVINPDGTVLGKGIVTALNRLKMSKAATKIIILLTDGDPTPELDIPIDQALAVARQLGVKIYTIGIGGEHGGLFEDPVFGVRSIGFRMNKKLLEVVAQQTGGMAFEAKKPEDLQRIYTTIDKLETSEYETTIYKNYYDIFMPFLSLATVLLIVEWIASTLIWFVI